MIDWQRVRELRDEIGAEDFDEVVPLFLEEVSDTIADMLSGDGAREAQFHFLKGAGLNLGFAALSDLCRRGEQAAAAGQPDTVSAAEVAACFEASKTAFETEAPAQLAA